MTHEESLMMWKLEMENFNKNIGMASKDMKKMYKILDTVITEGIITYENFTNDMIDELTTLMVEEGKAGKDPKDRSTEVDIICKRLAEKYETKYNERESGTGTTELSTDNTEVSDAEELHESECVSEECNGDSSEIA